MGDNNLVSLLIAGVLGFGLYQCTKAPEEPRAASAVSWPSSSTPSADDEDRADDAAADAMSGTTYAEQGRPYGCTGACSGHDAGYEWAQDNDVTDPDDCGGNSLSFEEGCRSRAEAYQEAREEALEEEE